MGIVSHTCIVILSNQIQLEFDVKLQGFSVPERGLQTLASLDQKVRSFCLENFNLLWDIRFLLNTISLDSTS